MLSATELAGLCCFPSCALRWCLPTTCDAPRVTLSPLQSYSGAARLTLVPALLMLLFLVKAQSSDAVSVLSSGWESPPACAQLLTEAITCTFQWSYNTQPVCCYYFGGISQNLENNRSTIPFPPKVLVGP